MWELKDSWNLQFLTWLTSSTNSDYHTYKRTNQPFSSFQHVNCKLWIIGADRGDPISYFSSFCLVAFVLSLTTLNKQLLLLLIGRPTGAPLCNTVINWSDPPLCNIVINWRDPSPPIRDYVIYEQPLKKAANGDSIDAPSCFRNSWKVFLSTCWVGKNSKVLPCMPCT